MNYRVIAVCILLLVMVEACRSDTLGVSMDPEMKRKLQALEQSIRKETITEGGFRLLKIGQPKKIVISSLREMGVSQVCPDTIDALTITHPSELQKIGNAESIVLNEGAVWIIFDGDVVRQLKTPPYSDLEHRFKPLKTRDEVFKMLADILSSDPKAYVRNLGADADCIANTVDDDMRILKKYDFWEANFNDTEGYSHLQLKFSNDLLKEIIIQRAPGELP